MVEPEPDPEPEQSKSSSGTLLLVLAVAVIGGAAGWYFKIYRPKKQQATDAAEGYGDDYRHGTGHGVGLRSMSSRFCRLRQSRCWLPAMLSRWSQGFTCPAGLASVSRIWPFLRRML